MWHMTSAGVPLSSSEVVIAWVTASRRAGRIAHEPAVSSVSHSAPSSSSASRSTGAPNRPCSHDSAGSAPSERPPAASSTSRVSAAARSTCSGAPWHSTRHRQPSTFSSSPILSVVARLTAVSVSSDRRSTVAPVPRRVASRNAAAPVAKSGKEKAS